jgi:long-chain fatty acid transport protein
MFDLFMMAQLMLILPGSFCTGGVNRTGATNSPGREEERSMREGQLWLVVRAWFRRVFVLTALCLCMESVWANGFRNPPEGAAALGLLGGKIALTEDATAISHNPANVALIPTKDYVASLTIVLPETEFTSPDGRHGETEGDAAWLPSVFFTSPATVKGKDIYLGLGLNSPWGQSTEWDENGPFAFVAPHFAELRTIALTPTVSFNASEKVLIGVGVDFTYSDVTFNQRYAWGMVTGDPSTPPGNLSLEGDGFGVSGRFGITWLMTESQRLAFTARTRMKVDYDGDAKVLGIPPPDELPGPLGAIITPQSNFETEIDFPAILALGYGIKVNEKFRAGVDFEWIEFSSFDELPLDLGNNSALLPFTSVLENWDDTITVGFGVEYDASDQVVLRGGYIWLESPIPEETLAPTLPDTDRHVLSVGFGYEYNQHTFDFAYALSFYDDLEVTTNLNPAFNGDYDIESHLIQLTYNYRF